jgi:hypothetical protein
METEKDFHVGFWFAILLAQTMGFNPNDDNPE